MKTRQAFLLQKIFELFIRLGKKMKYELDKTSGSARRGRLVFGRPQGTFSVI